MVHTDSLERLPVGGRGEELDDGVEDCLSVSVHDVLVSAQDSLEVKSPGLVPVLPSECREDEGQEDDDLENARN